MSNDPASTSMTLTFDDRPMYLHLQTNARTSDVSPTSILVAVEMQPCFPYIHHRSMAKEREDRLAVHVRSCNRTATAELQNHLQKRKEGEDAWGNSKVFGPDGDKKSREDLFKTLQAVLTARNDALTDDPTKSADPAMRPYWRVITDGDTIYYTDLHSTSHTAQKTNFTDDQWTKRTEWADQELFELMEAKEPLETQIAAVLMAEMAQEGSVQGSQLNSILGSLSKQGVTCISFVPRRLQREVLRNVKDGVSRRDFA